MTDEHDKLDTDRLRYFSSRQTTGFLGKVADEIDRPRAELAERDASPRPAVPEGWKMVPLEPTAEMLHAAAERRYGWDHGGSAGSYEAIVYYNQTVRPCSDALEHAFRHEWYAAIAAAPPQPEADAECPFGADCDLTTAYLAGQARGESSHPAIPEGVELELVSDMLTEYASALTEGLLDGAGRYLPADIQEQADLIADVSKPEADAGHPDDAAVERFAGAMKAKLAQKRAEGHGGWENKEACPPGRLQAMLLDHLRKGDPVDVGNFAMMLWNRGEPTETGTPNAGQARDAEFCRFLRAHPEIRLQEHRGRFDVFRRSDFVSGPHSSWDEAVAAALAAQRSEPDSERGE